MKPEIETPVILDGESMATLDWKPYEHRPTIQVAAKITQPTRVLTVGDRPNLNFEPGDYLVVGTDKRPYKVEGPEWEKLYKPL